MIRRIENIGSTTMRIRETVENTVVEGVKICLLCKFVNKNFSLSIIKTKFYSFIYSNEVVKGRVTLSAAGTSLCIASFFTRSYTWSGVNGIPRKSRPP